MRRCLALVVALVGFLVLPPAPQAGATTATAVFTRTSTWDGGYRGAYTVTNSGRTELSGWSVTFGLPAGTSVGAYWDAVLTRSGARYRFTGEEGAESLAPGASITFGWVSHGVGTPVKCRLNEGSCGGGGDSRAPNPPPGVRVDASSGSTLTVKWSASTDDSGAVPVYEISRDGGPPVPAAGTSYTATGLRPATGHTFRVRAKDASGNASAYSTPVNGMTTTAGGPSTARMAVAPYVDMGATPTPNLTEMAARSGLRNFTLAFVTASGCKAMWFNSYDPRRGWARDQIDAVRAAGGDVKISFGGAAGSELAQACRSVDALAAEYEAVVSTYDLTHIDFALDSSILADRGALKRRSQALARVQRDHPGLRISFTLPVFPEGLTPDALAAVAAARDAGVQLNTVKVMTVNYHRDIDYGDAAIRAARSTFTQLAALYPARSDAAVWAMVGASAMPGQNDDGRFFTLAHARRLVAFAQQQHLGELAFWEMVRDRNACMGPLFRCTNVPQTGYAFSKIFAKFTG
ncbi:cellulose binding domain-containing protein [Streptomyces sp. NPDC020965]|uniref:cellulose binding domain-containing protein n=1 Tax=Streptomyces sp. NPDC020965 TaxID=3365105 RepID=UPI0037A8E414